MLVKLVNVGMHPVFQVAMRSTLAILPILIYCYVTKKKIDFFDGSFFPGVIAGILFAPLYHVVCVLPNAIRRMYKVTRKLNYFRVNEISAVFKSNQIRFKS